MKILIEYPPIFEEIDKVFHVRGKPVIYAWGDTIYNPMSIYVSSHLMTHEMVHGQQQGDDIEGWWGRYLVDPEFRLEMELPAHKAEYRSMLKGVKDRNTKNEVLMIIAGKIASPIYNNIISRGQAAKLLRN
jgi:hypothetical protein